MSWSRMFGALLLPVLCACPRPVVPEMPQTPAAVVPVVDAGPCPSPRRADEFVVSGSNSLDVLLVVDTSMGSAAVLEHLPERLGPLLGFLVDPGAAGGANVRQTNFHYAIAPTHLGGELLKLNITAPDGGSALCDNCRYVSRSMCDDATCSVLQSPSAAEVLKLGAVDNHPAPGRMINTLNRALGLLNEPESRTPSVDPPPANAGFYRPEAGLAVFFVSGVVDPDLAASTALYDNTLRSLRNLKGPGTEDNVVMVTITGSPRNALDGLLTAVSGSCGLPENLPREGEGPAFFCRNLKRRLLACPGALETFSNACVAGSVREASSAVATASLSSINGCTSVAPALDVPFDSQLVGLTCDMDGVIYNACAADWRAVLQSRVTEFLLQAPSFILAQTPKADEFTASTVSDNCSGAPGHLCVEITTLDGRVQLAEATVTINEDGKPELSAGRVAPGARLVVRYDVESGGARCCKGRCSENEFCNAQGDCQESTCRGLTTCPSGALCDAVSGSCIPDTECTRPEHCPFAQTCVCGDGDGRCQLGVR